MAALDKERLIVRVAYAGAPMAGKTESVRALMPLLKGRGAEQKVMSPDEDRGRTAFFDWADYEGGAFEGKPIRCQITSAPGQIALSDRRELLLRGADAVILVVDSRSEAIERAQQCYEEMAPWLAEAGREVPIRMVLQCNKQDLPGSLTPDELSRALGLPVGKDVYPTSARTGKGLRAAFVAGVRAAVERAKVQIARGLILDAPEIASGEEMFEVMQRDAAFQNLSRRREPARARAASSEAKAAPVRAAPEPSPRAAARAPASSPPAAQRTAPARRSSPPARASSTALRAARVAPESSEMPSSSPAPIERAPDPTPASARSASPRASEAPSSDVAARAPARAARAFAPFERAASAVPSPTAPSSAAPSSAAPSSAASSPAATTRDAAAARAASPRAAGGSATARAPVAAPPKRITWSPESGTRPAVLPASVYHAAMARLTPAAPARLKSQPPLEPARARAAERPRAPQPPAKLGLASKSGVRPAVMPASAYYASLAAQASTPRAEGSAPAKSPGAPPERRAPAAKRFSASGVRPAVMPASAWRAAEALRASGDVARPLEQPAQAFDAPLPPPGAPSLLSPEEQQLLAPLAAPSGSPSSSLPASANDVPRREPLAASAAPASSRRPAVAPSSAWLAQHAAARAAAAPSTRAAPPPRRASAQSSVRPAVMPASAWEDDMSAWVAPAPAPRAARTGPARPAVMPASAWRALLASTADAARPAGEPEQNTSEQDEPPPSTVSPSRNGMAHFDELASGPLSSPFSASSAPEPSPSLIPSSDALPSDVSSGAATSSPPQLPGRSLAPSSVWPRSIWRILEPQITPRGRALKDARGRWLGELAPGWYARTLETATDLPAARSTFAAAVLRHRRLKPHLSAPRCLALTEEADRCLIWQIIYRVPTLAASLAKVLAAREAPSLIAEALVECAAGYLDARERFAALAEPLPLSLHALSAQDDRFVYAGLLPTAGTTLGRPLGDPAAGFEDALRKRWLEAGPDADVPAIIGALHGKAAGKLPEPIVGVIVNVLSGQ
jgi:signal recognition particle receptor subunit beta